MDPISQNSFFGGTDWLFMMMGGGVVLAFVLRKLGLIASDQAKNRFICWGAGIMAATATLSASAPSSNSALVNLGGRAAIFLLVWFVCGIMFGIGVAIGTEKAEKKQDD